MFLRCFFASLRAAFYTVKMISIPSQVAKSRTLICLVPLSLLRPHLLGVGAASSDGAMVRPTKYTRGRRDDAGGWWQELNSLLVKVRTRR